jgi:hypothetical protein
MWRPGELMQVRNQRDVFLPDFAVVFRRDVLPRHSPERAFQRRRVGLASRTLV